MYDGTLYGHWQAIVTFQQMIVLCDPEGMIDMTPQAIAARTSIPLEIIQEGVKILEQPDPYSRTPGEDGRRIVRLDDHRPWGWRIVNHRVYRDLVAAEDKRRADRDRIASKRALGRAPSQLVAECRDMSQQVANVAHTDTDTDTRERGARKKRASRVPEDFSPDTAFALREIPDLDVEREVQKFRDWEFKTPRSDWPAVWRQWIERCRESGKYAKATNGAAGGMKWM